MNTNETPNVPTLVAETPRPTGPVMHVDAKYVDLTFGYL